MSEFRVPIVEIGKVGKHPNADTLSITQVDGCPCIFRTGDFQPGDIAIYIPVDAVVPTSVPGTEFLKDKRRIRAMRLRGIFSMGLLLPYYTTYGALHPDLRLGRPTEFGKCLAAELGITKYEEPEPLHFQGEDAKSPSGISIPKYDVESYRNYRHVFQGGEWVVVTEKIHGTNSRFMWDGVKLHVGSHAKWKDPEGTTPWARVAKKYDLATKLAHGCFEKLVFYGEVYGQVQDLKYGAEKNELRLAIFDIYDAHMGRWLNYEEVMQACHKADLPTVPVLYLGNYDPILIDHLCDGDSQASSVKQIREGFVIKPTTERWNNEVGRVIAKLVGEEYNLRKGGTEYH